MKSFVRTARIIVLILTLFSVSTSSVLAISDGDAVKYASIAKLVCEDKVHEAAVAKNDNEFTEKQANICNGPGVAGLINAGGYGGISASDKKFLEDAFKDGYLQGEFGWLLLKGVDKSYFTKDEASLAASGADANNSQLTQAQLQNQAALLREKLSKGDNKCGDSQTVFDFGCTSNTGNPITDLLVTLVKFLTYGIGLLLILAVVISGFQYMTAQGNAQTTEKALKRIWNVVIALLLYIFGFALLNYLIPGGLLF